MSNFQTKHLILERNICIQVLLMFRDSLYHPSFFKTKLRQVATGIADPMLAVFTKIYALIIILRGTKLSPLTEFLAPYGQAKYICKVSRGARTVTLTAVNLLMLGSNTCALSSYFLPPLVLSKAYPRHNVSFASDSFGPTGISYFRCY